MRSVARWLVLLPVLWVQGLLCSSALGAEVVDQITLVRAVSADTVDALRDSDPNTLRVRSGDTLVLRLAASGPYEITIDKAHKSSLGNTIIRGTTPSGGSSLIVIGADGHVRGHFERPNEVVQVSSDEDGVVTAWVEGVDVEMLPINDEVIIPSDGTREDIAEPSIEKLRDSAAPEASAIRDADVSYARFKTGNATIRILIYYEFRMNAIGTVADYLVELTNEAFEASKISATLVITELKPVELGTFPLVLDVLNLMQAGESPFNSIEQDLSSVNADLAVTLVGDYNLEDPDPAGGIAPLGGRFSTERLSVTRYLGYQDGRELYPAYAFAHEIGHNLGAKHNRERYENNGQDSPDVFSYAFGYLIARVQNTIMSYRSEAYDDETTIPRFSHPSITYDGYPTGISTTRSDSAFVARAFTNNRHVAAGANQFTYERIGYSSYGYLDNAGCGFWRGMSVRNNSDGVISMESQNYVEPDGAIASYSLDLELQPGRGLSYGWCVPESEPHYLGKTYVESFYRYYHPITGELVEGPRFQWSATYIPQTELRIAYTDGGKPLGNTVRMMPVGEELDISFEADSGFSIEEIKSTCRGFGVDGGFRVTATVDPCLLEASFSANSTPPAAPTISKIVVGGADPERLGFIAVEVNVPDDGGAEVTEISVVCTFGGLVYSNRTTYSSLIISQLLNGRTYECSARATNANGTSPASASVFTTLPQTMPSQPTIGGTYYGDGEVTVVISEASQLTTVDRYNSTCTDGTNTYTGTSATFAITVIGLTNGVAYTCTVTATNSVGTSPASSSTDPVTPASFDDTPEAFVERHYVNGLGRLIDAAGLAAWVNVMETQSTSAVSNGILLSAEFKNRGLTDASFVNTLYKSFFNREAYPEEIISWATQLNRGRLRQMVIWDLVRGAKFKKLSDNFGVAAMSAADEAAYGIRAFTERFYTVVLGRYPDPVGFDGWVAGLTGGTLAGSDLARGFFLSPEYTGKNKSDSAFLDDSYQAYFDRAADAGGKQGWLDALAQGMTRTEVLDGFSGSQEFIALAESYGIRPFAGYGSARVAREADGIPIPVFPIPLFMLLAGLLCLVGFRKLQSA